MDRVHIFWDNSNIFIPAGYVARRREGDYAERTVRIQFDNLYELARASRTVASAFCVGSVPPELDKVWAPLRSSGVEVELYERGQGSGKEQAVDQSLQVHMLRALADNDSPQIAVLLTGDGAGYEEGKGFWADLERMAKKGWGVEVLSWDISCNKGLRDWAQKNGVYVPLEDHYDSVTFTEGTRKAQSVNLKRRSRAKLSSTNTPPSTLPTEHIANLDKAISLAAVNMIAPARDVVIQNYQLQKERWIARMNEQSE